MVERSETEPEAQVPAGGLFDLVVRAEIGLGLLLVVAEGFLVREPPEFVASYLHSLSSVPGLDGVLWLGLSLTLFLASRLLLLKRYELGRHLLLLGVLLYAVAPSSGNLPTYFGNLLAAILLLLEGAIVGMAFSRPIAQEFEDAGIRADRSRSNESISVADESEEPTPRRETWGFDVLLFLHLMLYFSWYFLDVVRVDLPTDVKAYFEGRRFTEPWLSRMLAYWQVWEMFFLASIGFLFFRIDLGRKLFVVVLACLYLTPSGFYSPVSAAGSFLSYLQVLSHGAILALLSVGPVRAEFARMTEARRARG